MRLVTYGQFVSVVVSLVLVGFVFGVESLQQGSQDAPWDSLMCVYQRLDCLLHLQSKNTNRLFEDQRLVEKQNILQ